MDWFTPRPSPKFGYRITIGSDWAPIWAYEPVLRDHPTAVYGDTLPILQESDLNVVNVECVLGDAGAPIPKPGPCLRGDEALAIPALTAVPFHVATLANNHAMDYGPESLAATLRILQAAGLRTVGAGPDPARAAEPLLLPGGEHFSSLAIVNFGEGEACASLDGRPGVNVYDLEIQEEQIRALKRAGHLVIAIFHGGREHAASPPPFVVKGLRRLARAGADAVVAHHPHVPQAVEISDGVPIAYSLGNFVFLNPAAGNLQRIGYLVHLDVSRGKITAATLTPYRMNDGGLRVLAGDELQRFLDDLRQLSAFLTSPDAVEALWNAFIDESGYFHDGRREEVHAEQAIIERIAQPLEMYASEPAKAIAYFHHYFFCPAHREFFHRAFQRLKLGTFGNSPEWARRWVKKWKS